MIVEMLRPRHASKVMVGVSLAGLLVAGYLTTQQFSLEYGETLAGMFVRDRLGLVLQLVLVGQPELRDTLRQPNLEQFAQRVSVDYHLDPLDRLETREYIEHRLVTAGGAKHVISRAAMDLIFELSTGVPRIINSLCDTALVYAFADGKQKVTPKLVRDIVAEKKAKGLFGAGKIYYEKNDFSNGPT